MTSKIRIKLLITMLAIGLIAAIPISFISIQSLIDSSKKQAKDFGQQSASYNSKIIGTWITEKSDVLIALKKQIQDMRNQSDIINLMKLYSDSNKDFISIFIGMEDNVMLDAYNWQPPPNYKVVDRPWYRGAIDKASYVTTSVYCDANKQKNVTAVATRADALGKQGVLAANIYVDYIVEIIEDIKFGENGFAVLVDEDYQVITGVKSATKSKLFTKIIDLMLENERALANLGVRELTIDDVDYIVTYSNIENIDWKLVLISPMADFIRDSKLMQNQLILIILFIVILIMLIDYYISFTISKPIEDMVSAVSGIARGDFDKPVSIQSNDEIGDLSKEIEKMRNNLKKIFESLRYESKIVSMNSKNLEEHLSETYRGTTRFMLMLSHDIKTPITLIKGYSKALSTNMVDPEKTREYIEKIQYRSEQIENIVTDTLDNTYEVANITVNLKELSVVDYINMVRYNAENYISNQLRRYDEDIDQSLLTTSQCLAIDLTKIQRVVNNIMSNAVKFSEEDSPITLVIKRDGDRLLTYFQDRGIGIKVEDKEKIFNMFYKTDSGKKGYGLGLYINKAIVEAHDGMIYFKSEFKRGTACGYYLNLSTRK